MKKFLLSLTSTALFLSSCTKKYAQVPDGWANNTYGPDLSHVHGTHLPAQQHFTLVPGTNIFTTVSGIRFTIPDSAFTYANSNVSNAGIIIDLTEYITNVDLVGGQIMTVAPKAHKVLINGGLFNISVSPSYKLVKQLEVSIPEKNGNFNSDFKIYARPFITGGGPYAVAWEEDAPAINWIRGLNGTTSTYDFEISELKYYMLGRPVAPSQPVTTLLMKLPNGFGNNNTTMYLTLPETGATHLAASINTLSFNASDFDLPLNMPVKLLTIGYQNNKCYYDLRSFNTIPDQIIKIDGLSEISDQSLQSLIETQLN